MRTSRQTYNAIPTVQISSKDVYPWYWRFLSFAASWMILGGYITISATFDSEAQLRTSKNALIIISIGLLTTGYALTALLCFARRDWVYQSQDVFRPALASCTLGLLSVVYPFVISHRYVWRTASTITSVVAALTALVYTALLLYTQRKLSRDQKRYAADANYPLSYLYALQSNQEGGHLNAFGSDTLHPYNSPFSGHPWLPHNLAADEVVDPTVWNFRTLLDTTTPDWGTSPPAEATSTYHIELPKDPDESEESPSLPAGVQEFYNPTGTSPNSSGRKSGPPPPERARSGSDVPSTSSGLGLGIIRTDQSGDGSGDEATAVSRLPGSRGQGGGQQVRRPSRGLHAEAGKRLHAGRQRARSMTPLGDDRWPDRAERRREIENPYTRSAVALAGNGGKASREDRRREIELG